MSRRAWLVVAVVLLCLLPLAGGSAGCVLGARSDAEHYANPGGRSLPLPTPVAWSCALLGQDASVGAATGSGLGYALGLVAVALAALADRRVPAGGTRRAHGGTIAIASSVIVGLAVGGIALLAVLRNAVSRARTADKAACTTARDDLAKAWDAYTPPATSRNAVSGVKLAIGSQYMLEELCTRARAVPPDPGSAAYARAMAATEAAWRACSTVEPSVPRCTR